MSRDLRGLSVIIGDDAVAMPRNKTMSVEAAGRKQKALDAVVSASRYLIIGGILGVVVGTVGGALLWKAHRVAGALIGGLIVGPVTGYGIGFLVAQSKLRQLQGDE